jgi:hypothetical protein
VARRKVAKSESSTEAESLQQIATGLNRVGRAIVIAATKDASESEQAFYLNLAGFAPVEIGEIYGEKTNVISARISNVRKAKLNAAKKQK